MLYIHGESGSSTGTRINKRSLPDSFSRNVYLTESLSRKIHNRQIQAFYPMFLCIYLSQFWIIKPQSDEYFLEGQIFSCGSNEKWAKWHVFFFSPPRIVKYVLLMFRASYSLFQALTQRRQRKLPVNEDWQLSRKQKRCSFPFLNFFTPSVFDVIYGLEN